MLWALRCVQVFFPTEDRCGADSWPTRLPGPALEPSPGRPNGLRFNLGLHRQIWGVEYLRGHANESAEPSPDDLLKFFGAGMRRSSEPCVSAIVRLDALTYTLCAESAAYFQSFSESKQHPYEAMAQCYCLICRCGMALNIPSVCAAMAARLQALNSPLTGEFLGLQGVRQLVVQELRIDSCWAEICLKTLAALPLAVDALHHVIHHQKVFQAIKMYRNPEERKHRDLQVHRHWRRWHAH